MEEAPKTRFVVLYRGQGAAISIDDLQLIETHCEVVRNLIAEVYDIINDKGVMLLLPILAHEYEILIKSECGSSGA